MTGPSDRDSDGWAVLNVPLDSKPPGPIATEEEDDGKESEADDSAVLTPEGPPGGRIFSLEGRPAAGLYLVAWLFSLGGFAVLFMSLLASAEGISGGQSIQPLLGLVGTGMLGLGLVLAAGYQVVARGLTRAPEAYRGPSPLILFGVALLVAGIASVALVIVGLPPTANALAFVVNLLAVEAAYAIAVWLLVVRTQALSWRDMGWPVRRTLPLLATDVTYGVALMIPTFLGIGIVGAIVARILDVSAPDILPLARGNADQLLLAFATIVLAPVGEELFFRGFALTAWRRDLGVRAALIRSALFFALIHIVNIQSVDFATGLKQVVLVLVEIIPLGLVLGWLFVRRGLLASIAGHATYNAVIFVAGLLVANVPNV